MGSPVLMLQTWCRVAANAAVPVPRLFNPSHYPAQPGFQPYQLASSLAPTCPVTGLAGLRLTARLVPPQHSLAAPCPAPAQNSWAHAPAVLSGPGSQRAPWIEQLRPEHRAHSV